MAESTPRNGAAIPKPDGEPRDANVPISVLREQVEPVGYWTVGFLVPFAVLVGLIVWAGASFSDYGLTVMAQIGIFAIVILGLNVLVGFAGQISFGHNAFLGLGGYMSALATTQWGLPPILGLVIGVAVSILIGMIVGYPTLRLRGHYLALATFALGLGFYNFAISSPAFNGFMGIAAIPPFSLGPWSFETLAEKHYLVWVVTLLAVLVTWRLRQMRFGRALRSVAVDEATAQSVGVNVQRYKVVAFVTSGIFASVAGSLYAHTVSFVSPDTFGFSTILLLFVMLFVGGLGTLWGSLLGAAAGIALPDMLRAFEGWNPSIFALILLVVLIVRPMGLLAPLRSNTVRRLLKPIALGPKTEGTTNG
ncbi:MAG: branched-chain amino acid ABC transporter permease [Acidimicrobiia bacterium]|nr:branched-chain amino acid ABC transporter permease [Acidimicrobiia bacterium]